jgi:hypothetical protein
MFVSLIYCLGHILKNFVDTGSILTVFLRKAATVVTLWFKETLGCQECKNLFYPVILNYSGSRFL